MNRFELASAIYEASHLEGEFLLSSGLKSEHYFDKYRFEGDPEIMRSLLPLMTSLIPHDTEALAGIEVGGIPLSTGLSIYTQLPQVIVRHAPKEYGTRRRVEGPDIKGKKVLIVEDVVTTGRAIAESAGVLREMEAGVEYAVCAVDRSDGDLRILRAKSVLLKSAFNMQELQENHERYKRR